MPTVKSGKVRAIAVTSAKRTAVAPEIPTIAETVPGYELTGWIGILAPAATSPAITAMLNKNLIVALHQADVQKRFVAVGVDSVGTSQEEFSKFLKSEIAKMSKLLPRTGMQQD